MAMLSQQKEGKELWAVLIFVVFVIIIIIVIAVMFTRDNRRAGGEGLAEAATIPLIAAAASRPHYDGGGYSHGYNYMMAHDGQRDNLKEFGCVKVELMCNRYEAAKEVADAKHEAYRATKESEEKVLLAIAESERRTVEREDRRKDAEIAYLRNRDMFYSFNRGNIATVNVQDIGVGGGYGNY